MKEVLRQIRTDLRLSMNGAVSASMRNKGVNYKMIFGVEVPRIIRISDNYEASKSLAETLWGEDVREMKIMATLLYPKDEFSKETAMRWISDICDQELREQICKNLFQELLFSDELVEESINNRYENIRTTGYWLFARLCIKGSDFVNKIKSELLIEKAIEDLKSDSMLLRQSSLSALRFYGRATPENSEVVLSKLESFKDSSDTVEKEMYEQLFFEFYNEE